MVIEQIFEDNVERVVGVDLHLHGPKSKPSRSVMDVTALELAQLSSRLQENHYFIIGQIYFNSHHCTLECRSILWVALMRSSLGFYRSKIKLNHCATRVLSLMG